MTDKELALRRLKAYGRVIAFVEIFMDVTEGSASAALLLSQAVWHQEKTKNPDAWFGLTYEDWYRQTRLSRHQIDTARKVLGAILKSKKMGIPVKNYYQVDVLLLCQRIDEIIMANPDEYKGSEDDSSEQYAGKRQTDCGLENSTPESGESVCRKAAVVMPESGSSDAGKRVNVMPESGESLRSDLRRCTEDVQKRGSRARAKAPQASEAAISFVKAFRERFPHYPSFQEPKQIARELAAAEYLLKCGTAEEHLELAERVLSGFPGNRRKAATVKDLWENLTALRAEHSDLGAKAADIQRVREMIENMDRPKTEAELIEEWQDYTNVRIENGNLPDYSAAPECVKRAVAAGIIVQKRLEASGGCNHTT